MPDTKPCQHTYYYSAATNEDGWCCPSCGDKPGEPPGFSPWLDRKNLSSKVFALLNDLHGADLIYISNGEQGDAIVAAVAGRCLQEKRFDQYSILRLILEQLADRHAEYWSKVSEAIMAGKDERHRCHCGKLANVSQGDKNFCTEHWSLGL